MQGANAEDQVAAFKAAAKIIEDSAGKTTEEIQQALTQTIADANLAKKIEVRNRALNALAKKRMTEFVDSFDDPVEGVESLLVGTNRLTQGSRRSVAAEQSQLQEYYLSGLMADLEDLGRPAFDAFTKGDIDDDIVRALWNIDNPEYLAKLSDDAVGVAKTLNKWQEKSRIDANNAGAFIKKINGYVTRQTHDMDKIRNANKDKWIEDIKPLLDQKTFDGIDNVDKFLSGVYEGLSTGIHLGNGSVTGFKGSRNLGKSASAERVLHFKDADSYIKYNSVYGRGSLADTVTNGLRMSAQNTGLMKMLGVNAEMNYNELMDDILRSARKDSKLAQKVKNAKVGKLDNYLKMVTGETSIPANHMWASIFQGVRAYQSLTKLGSAVISSIADIGIGASELRYQGQGFLQAYGRGLQSAGGALADMGKSIINRKLTVKDKATRRVMAELGVSLDMTTGSFTSRFDLSGEQINGRISNAMRTFFRLNGLTLWTDSMRTGSMIGMAQHVGDFVGGGFNKLPKGLQNTFKLFDIQKEEWNLITSVGAKSFDGVDGKYLTPESMAELSDEAIKKYLNSKSVKATGFQIKKTREEMQDRLRTYYVDRSQYAVIEPDAKTRATMLRDNQAGTTAGEMLRSFTQFKAFPFAIVQKVWGREIYGRETSTASIKALSEMMFASMVFGYMAMSAKDIAKNRVPRDPTDPKTITAAFLQGGGAGIYGDFLFGDIKTRFGGGPIGAALGPTVGTGEKLLDIIGKAKEGDPDVGKDLFRLLYQSAPAAASVVYPPASIINTVYSKAVLDNLIYYNVMESLDKGYKRRMEKRLKRENDQELLIK